MAEITAVKRRLVATLLAAVVSATIVFSQPAAAQGGGCAEFGQNISFLGPLLGPVFGQTAASTAPLNGTVEEEQDVFCD
jgi:type IV secretory pathway VirB2 component (pilin)